MLVGILDRVSLCGSFSLSLSSSVLYFSVFFISFCPVPDILAGDQSPSSPASRWPGGNYGSRTLGV